LDSNKLVALIWMLVSSSFAPRSAAAPLWREAPLGISWCLSSLLALLAPTTRYCTYCMVLYTCSQQTTIINNIKNKCTIKLNLFS
jgi:hypothetical protein